MEDYQQQSFKELEEWVKSGVTLVDFESPWCRPCRDQKPISRNFGQTIQGRGQDN